MCGLHKQRYSSCCGGVTVQNEAVAEHYVSVCACVCVCVHSHISLDRSASKSQWWNRARRSRSPQTTEPRIPPESWHTYLQHIPLCQGSAAARDTRKQRERVGGEISEGEDVCRGVGALCPVTALWPLSTWRGQRRKSEETSNRRRGKCCSRDEALIIRDTCVCVLVGCQICCLARGMARSIIQLEVKEGLAVGWVFSPQPNSRPAHRSLNPLLPSHLTTPLPPQLPHILLLLSLPSERDYRRENIWGQQINNSLREVQYPSCPLCLFHYVSISHIVTCWWDVFPVKLSPLHGHREPS